MGCTPSRPSYKHDNTLGPLPSSKKHRRRREHSEEEPVAYWQQDGELGTTFRILADHRDMGRFAEELGRGRKR